MIASKLPAAIIGLGKTGISVAKFFKKNKIEFKAYDTRKDLDLTDGIKKNIKEENIILGPLENKLIASHDNFIVSPGVCLKKDFIEKINSQNKNIQTDVDIFDSYARKNIVCVTGSNGKTSVTLILEYMLKFLGKKVAAGGNVGTPVLELLYNDYEYHILELSSFQLEMTKKIQCDVSLITNITPDHLDRHKNFENYKKIKHKIFLNSNSIVINRTDRNINVKNAPLHYSFGRDTAPNKSSFGIVKIDSTNYIVQGSEKILSENEIKLIGRHNLENICASLAVINILNLDLEKAVEGIKDFKSIQHRMEKFCDKNKISWINDSKSTNIESTISAVKSISGNIILILGGRSKTNNYDKLQEVLQNKSVFLILYGECKNLLNENIKIKKNKVLVEDIKSAVDEAYKIAKSIPKFDEKKITILLSPACSSFDMYSSFEERGDHFKNEVLKKHG